MLIPDAERRFVRPVGSALVHLDRVELMHLTPTGRAALGLSAAED